MVSAASRALGRLEEKLQTTLLRRTTRRLELTEEGANFLEHARAKTDAPGSGGFIETIFEFSVLKGAAPHRRAVPGR